MRGPAPTLRTHTQLTPHDGDLARVRQVVLDRERLVFVRDGALWAEPPSGGAVLLASSDDGAWSSIAARDGHVIGVRGSALAVLSARDGSTQLRTLPGDAFGVAADAPLAVALDVLRGEVLGIEISSGFARELALVPSVTSMPAQRPGPIAVAPDGSHALLSVTDDDGAVQLVFLDLFAGTQQVVTPPLEQCVLTGAVWTGSGARRLVVVEHTDGDGALVRVRVDGVVILTRGGHHPRVPPLVWSDSHIMLLVTIDAATDTGTWLCALDDEGALTPLVQANGDALRRDADCVLVEGGSAVHRVELVQK